MKVKSESEVTQSCPSLSDPMDCSPLGSSVHGIFQARGLEWGAITFSGSPENGVHRLGTSSSRFKCANMEESTLQMVECQVNFDLWSWRPEQVTILPFTRCAFFFFFNLQNLYIVKKQPSGYLITCSWWQYWALLFSLWMFSWKPASLFF